MYGWLVAPMGAELSLTGEPGLTWRDAVVTGASDWDSLFEDGSCEVEFTCFDPVAYGDGKSSSAGTLTVGGTWGDVARGDADGARGPLGEGGRRPGALRARGAHVRRRRRGSLLDFQHEAVTVDGVDASADVAVESTFFSLAPGSHTLAFSGCSAHTVEWVERWL